MLAKARVTERRYKDQRGETNIRQHTRQRQNSDSPEARGSESARGKVDDQRSRTI